MRELEILREGNTVLKKKAAAAHKAPFFLDFSSYLWYIYNIYKIYIPFSFFHYRRVLATNCTVVETLPLFIGVLYAAYYIRLLGLFFLILADFDLVSVQRWGHM